MKEALEVLDHVRLNFSPSGLLALNITIAFIMFGVALDIKFEHFRELVKRPKPVIVGIISQFFLLPAVTFLFIILLNPTPTVALGMILIASCPGGNISNFMSALAKGNLALSVSLTAIATLAATFMTPINFAVWGKFYINFYNNAATFMTPINFAVWGKFYINFYNNAGANDFLVPIKIEFLQMAQTVIILLGVPVIIGLLFAQYLPKITLKIKKPIRQLSILIFIAFVIILLSANFNHFLKFVHLVFLIVLIHNGLALLAGYSFSSAMRLPRIDRRTITIETGIQNSGLALVLMFNPKIFPPELELGGMTIIAAWWGVWHILSGFGVSYIMARFKIRKSE